MNEDISIGLSVAAIFLAIGVSLALIAWAERETVICECAKAVQVDE